MAAGSLGRTGRAARGAGLDVARSVASASSPGLSRIRPAAPLRSSYHGLPRSGQTWQPSHPRGFSLRSATSPELDDDRRPIDGGLTFAGPSSRSISSSSGEASRRMAAVRRSDTSAELRLRRELHARGLRYRVDVPVLPDRRRRADIVFRTQRVVVFVDGCFWHGCPQHASWPAKNAEFWRQKIEANRRRDTDTNARLEGVGWRVVRIWEHDDPSRAADRIEALIRDERA